MKRQIRLVILAASLVVALSAGLGWAMSPVNQILADSPVIAANGHGPGDGSGNGGDGPRDGTGHGPGDCSLNQMKSHSAKDFLAGHGKGHGKGNGRGHGPGDGSGASYHGQGFAERNCYDSENTGGAGRTGTFRMIETGEPMELSGTIVEVCTEGQGIKIDTGVAVVTVYGIGPIRYWADEGVARPTVGEDVTVNAVEVIFSDGSTKLIATDMTVSGETIDLRDDAGFPLWRGGNSQRVQKRDCLE